MLYKTTSIKRVIAKVFTDLDLKEGDHRLSDMLEWAGEGLEKIGAFPSFENKVTGKDDVPIIVLSNYQGQLPCDFHSLIQVAYSPNEGGPYYPMRYATGSFDTFKSNTVISTTVVGTDDLVILAMELYTLTYPEALEKINTEPSLKILLEALLQDRRSKIGLGETSFTTDLVYIIKPGYIKTNVDTGYLMMAYQAIPTDSEGYPLVPDDPGFLEALYWYINMKLLYPQWKEGRVRDAVYLDAKKSWNYYCKQAYGNALMPAGLDQWETIKNAWLRLVPEINEHGNFFSTLGQQQIIFNRNE